MLRISGREENRSRNCHCFCPESFFLAPSVFGKRKLPQTWCPSGCECSSPSALYTQHGKTSPREFWGEKTLLWIEIFPPSSSIFSTERAVNGSQLNSSQGLLMPYSNKMLCRLSKLQVKLLFPLALELS